MSSFTTKNKVYPDEKIDQLCLSEKGNALILMYEKMVKNGYDKLDNSKVDIAYEDFELKLMKKTVRDIFSRFKIKTILDYGSGGCDWSASKFDEKGKSAMQYFQLDSVNYYEPARNIDERKLVDCVISFDVLEHIYISDVPAILNNIFTFAKKLVVLNIACYEALALLPNGENAHITVRHPQWWKGMVDSVSINFPNVKVLLLTSLSKGKAHQFPIFSDAARRQDQRFSVSY